MHIQLIGKRESTMTGTSRYTSDLYEELIRTGTNVQLTYPDRPKIPAVLQNGFQAAQLDMRSFFASYPMRASLNNADVYHISGQMLATLLLFQRFLKPVVVTVLDIIPFLVRNQPEFNTFRHPIDLMFYRLALSGLRKADGLIAVSNYTRRSLIEILQIPPERIDLVYQGINSTKFRPMELPPAFWDKFGLNKGEKYILYVGSEDPRKNLATLIRAFAQVKKHIPGVKLLKVGAAYFNQERQKLQNLIQEMNLQKDILFLNYVSEEDLPCFYNVAEVLVMPSFYEGFGLPIAEAMACGTPVVCSWAGSLPEVAGDAGIQVDPKDPQAIAEAILTLLDNPDQRSSLKQAGLQQVSRFSIEHSVCETQKVYAKRIAESPRKKHFDRLSNRNL